MIISGYQAHCDQTKDRHSNGSGMGVLCLLLLLVLAFVTLAACGENPATSRVLYVSALAADGGDGRTWETAFDHPQDAMDEARKGDVVWVAQGIYGPRCADGSSVVRLVEGVMVLGGFDGSENSPSQRNHLVNTTVFDGQGTSFHVVMGADKAVLDGFTVTGGSATGNIVQSRYGGTFNGGGMFNAGVSPEIRNCRFTGNEALAGGGAIYNEGNAPLIADCVFEYNQADFGGAMENRDAAPTVINSHFKSNTSRFSGGGIASFNGAPLFLNDVFSGNRSTYVGGAVLGNASDAVFTNCSFTGNRSQAGAGIGMWKGSSAVKNTIFWNNAAGDGTQITDVEGAVEVQYSIIQGGYDGTRNLDEDPCFQQEGQWGPDGHWIDGVYELCSSSPALDSGTDEGAPGYDLRYNPRPQSLAHDMGAYERSGL